MKKVLLILLLIVIFIAFLLKWFYDDWNKSDPRIQEMMLDRKYKKIYIDQKIDSILTYAIYDLYTEKEAEKYQQPYSDENYVDSFSNGNIWCISHRTSMLCNDTVPFPSTFKIRIYHKNELIKEYDYEAFIKEIQKDSIFKDVNPLSLNSWTLVVDSTLFIKK